MSKTSQTQRQRHSLDDDRHGPPWRPVPLQPPDVYRERWCDQLLDAGAPRELERDRSGRGWSWR
jgi:hypothetical protein